MQDEIQTNNGDPMTEPCGFLPEGKTYVVGMRGYVGYGSLGHRYALPNYLNDLNAMREAENRLNYYQLSTYEDMLVKVVNAGDSATWWYEDSGYRLAVIRATAAQRAEAFLRTLNLWTDEND